MPPLARLSPVAAAVVEDHRRLRTAADELAETAIHTPPVAEGGRWCGDLASRLHELSSGLDRHFRHEEEDGLYAELAQGMPDEAGQIVRLQEQHLRLAQTCRALADEAATTPLDEEAFCRLAARIAAFVAELASHEAGESDLMLRASREARTASDEPVRAMEAGGTRG